MAYAVKSSIIMTNKSTNIYSDLISKVFNKTLYQKALIVTFKPSFSNNKYLF